MEAALQMLENLSASASDEDEEEQEDMEMERSDQGLPPPRTTTNEYFTFDIAKNKLVDVLTRLEAPPAPAPRGRRGRGRGRGGNQQGPGRRRGLPKLDWAPILNSYNMEAGTNGLSVDDIKSVWKVITSKPIKMKVTERAGFVLTMVPQMKIPGQFVEEMLDWMFRTTAEAGVFDRLQTNLLIYMIGLAEYGLIDGDTLSEPFYYLSLVFLMRMHTAIPYLCTLLKFVTTPAHVTADLVNDLMKLRAKKLSRRALVAVNNLLITCRNASPKMIPRSSLSARMIGSHYTVEIDPNFQKKMFDAQGRVAGRPRADMFVPLPRTSVSRDTAKASAVMDLFFDEFKPKFDIGTASASYADLAVHERMHYCLVSDELLFMVLQNPNMFSQFDNWISLIFRHKFENYDVTQAHRYKFILDKCNQFSRILTVSLPSVDDWLPDYLITWDGVLFRDEIFELISRLSILDFEHGYMCILDKFERYFVDGNLNERLEIWKLLEKLYIFWVDMILTHGTDQVDNSERSPPDCVNTLFNFMNKLLNVHAAVVGKIDAVILYVVCDTFKNFLDDYKSCPGLMPPLAPIVLWFQVLASKSYRLLDFFCYIAQKSAQIGGNHIELNIEFLKFFERCGAGLSYVFRPELKYIAEQRENGDGGAGAAGGSDLPSIEELEEKLNKVVNLNCYNCQSLKPFRFFKMDSAGGTNMIFKFGRVDVAPSLIKVLQDRKIYVEVGTDGGGGGEPLEDSDSEGNEQE